LNFQSVIRIAKLYRSLLAASVGLAAKVTACRAIFYYTAYRLGVFSKSKVLQMEVAGCKFEIDFGRKELASVLEVLLDGAYGLDGRWATRSGDTVFDVGSNIGVFAVMQGKQAAPGKVYAFEPSPTTYSRLKRNLALNDLKNVESFPYAIGDEIATLRFVDTPISLNSRLVEESMGAPTVDVLGTTLDVVAAAHNVQRIDLMKVDTEGHEIQVLRGGSFALSITRRLVVELHRASDEAPIRAMLEAAGFAPIHQVEELRFFERKEVAP
jgi:FkbM family methyltransferase